jgi:hypothetical protein
MQIDPVSAGAVHAAGAVTPTSGPSAPPTHMNGTLDGIASALGLGTDALRSQLQAGTSLADVAQQQGVSRSDLLKVIENQVQTRRASAGQDPVDATTLNRIANRAIDRGGRTHHHHHHGPTPVSLTPATSDPDAPRTSIDLTA